MKRPIIGNLKLTTVKVFEDRYKKFKEQNIDCDMTLQKLVNRSLTLYLADDKYKQTIDEMLELQTSGSSF